MTGVVNKTLRTAKSAFNYTKTKAQQQDYVFITLCAVLIVTTLLTVSVVLPSLLKLMDVIIVTLIAVLGALFAFMFVIYFSTPHENIDM